MKINKVIIKVLIISTIFFIFLNIQNTVKAGEFIENAEGFLRLPQDNQSDEVISEDGLKQISNSLLSILIPVGIVVSVVVTAILGAQFMWGSTENKAEVKQALVPWGVSIFVLFSAYAIWKVVVDILSSATAV